MKFGSFKKIKPIGFHDLGSIDVDGKSRIALRCVTRDAQYSDNVAINVSAWNTAKQEKVQYLLLQGPDGRQAILSANRADDILDSAYIHGHGEDRFALINWDDLEPSNWSRAKVLV